MTVSHTEAIPYRTKTPSKTWIHKIQSMGFCSLFASYGRRSFHRVPYKARYQSSQASTSVRLQIQLQRRPDSQKPISEPWVLESASGSFIHDSFNLYRLTKVSRRPQSFWATAEISHLGQTNISSQDCPSKPPSREIRGQRRKRPTITLLFPVFKHLWCEYQKQLV